MSFITGFVLALAVYDPGFWSIASVVLAFVGRYLINEAQWFAQEEVMRLLDEDHRQQEELERR